MSSTVPITERQIADEAIVSEGEHPTAHDNLTGQVYTTNSIKSDLYLDLTAITIPSNISGRIYHKTTDGKLYFMNGTTEYDLTAQGGTDTITSKQRSWLFY